MRLVLPLFPLGTVLFPGGRLPLRVFEARYVDMVRDALREDGEFGVVRIRRGREVARPDDKGAEIDIEAVGCRARIASWDMEQLGVLTLETVGTERFRVLSRIVKPDGLVVADVETIAADPATGVPAEAAFCAGLLERIVAELRSSANAAGRTFEPLAEPHRFDDAAWVGNRLAELLPLAPAAKQQLMEMEDPVARLASVRRYLVGQGIE